MGFIAGEQTPTQRAFDDLSDAHKAAVASIVNRHIDLVAARIQVAGHNTVRDHLRRAPDSVPGERNESDRFARNVTLRGRAALALRPARAVYRQWDQQRMPQHMDTSRAPSRGGACRLRGRVV